MITALLDIKASRSRDWVTLSANVAQRLGGIESHWF
jgi:hypothetical protein